LFIDKVNLDEFIGPSHCCNILHNKVHFRCCLCRVYAWKNLKNTEFALLSNFFSVTFVFSETMVHEKEKIQLTKFFLVLFLKISYNVLI